MTLCMALASTPALTAVDPARTPARPDAAPGRNEQARAGTEGIDVSRVRTSDGGTFTVAIESELEPIEINRLHRWTLHVETAAGAPVIGADIAMDGGMPMHDHGLPTAPRITRELGDGAYLVEGIRFQMPGHWNVTFDIAADGERDSVTFDLEL